MSRARRRIGVAIAATATLVATAGLSAAAAAGQRPHHSHASHLKGTLNVLQTAAGWPTLGPATNNQSASVSSVMNAIYGGLFEFGDHGSIKPDLATGYTMTNHNKTLTITIRPHVRFANGMAMTAADVAASIRRDLLPSNGCACDSDFAPVSKVTSSGDKVILHLSTPDTALIRAFDDEPPNWPIPMSLVKTPAEAKKFEQVPTGAGPFGKVLRDVASSKVTMAANPYYWHKGEPKVAKMTYTSVGGDQSAYASLETGQSQVSLLVTTVPVIKQAQSSSSIKVVKAPATFYQFVSLNSKIPPFNNPKARLALLEATNSKELVKNLYGGLYTVSEGPTARGEPFYEAKVPGYPSYNLKKAKALVKQLGGISFKLSTTFNTTYWTTEASYLTGMWSKAGIHASVEPNTLAETLVQLKSDNWSSLLSNWGAPDPGVALPTYFSSHGPFSGIHNAGLDALMNAGVAIKNPTARGKIYDKIYSVMAKHADVDFLYSKPWFSLATKQVVGLPTNHLDIYWEHVSLK